MTEEKHGESREVLTDEDEIRSGYGDMKREDYAEEANECDHVRFYADWTQCHYQDCPLDEDMKARIEKCRAACVRRLDPLGYHYELELPDRMYALQAEHCVCEGKGKMETICICPRPTSITLGYGGDDDVLDEPPFTALNIRIDCERYKDVEKVYAAIGVDEDKATLEDDRMYVFCMRKAFWDRVID